MMSSGGNEDRGKPVRCIDTLDAEKVIAAWPPVGGARAVPITEMLDGYLMGAVRDPTGWWLPDDVRPLKRTRSEVRASDETWYKLCRAAHERGLMKVVSDSLLHKDREGHYVTNGAGGVEVQVDVSGRLVAAQWFVPIMLPSNEHSERLPGGRDVLPYGGLLEAIVLPEEGDYYMESWPLSRALSVFSVPDLWLPHFAFSKKVCASAFGGTKGVQVRPAWCVLPCGWKNTLALVEGALRLLVFGRCRVPRPAPTTNRWPPLSSDQLAVDCSDFIAELLCMRDFCQELDAGVHSEKHRRFETECRAAGLPMEATRLVMETLTRGVSAGAMDGPTESLRATRQEVMDFVALSLGLLQAQVWRAPHLHYRKSHLHGVLQPPIVVCLGGSFSEVHVGSRGACTFLERNRRGDLLHGPVCSGQLPTQVRDVRGDFVLQRNAHGRVLCVELAVAY